MGAVVFWFFCESDLQPWAVIETSSSFPSKDFEENEIKEPIRF